MAALVPQGDNSTFTTVAEGDNSKEGITIDGSIVTALHGVGSPYSVATNDVPIDDATIATNGLAMYHHDLFSNMVVEARTLRDMLRMCCRFGFLNVSMESDMEILCNVVNSTLQAPWKIDGFITEIFVLMDQGIQHP
ncbi:hypothetical protein ACH5RR_029440 [Cinchona calisaya]|uniref:RNase H type-1 domain-containing protein n=1 Tax=Cinchona calisaya TaxID=153742 RepID=A0ABD2YV09_9GENT